MRILLGSALFLSLAVGGTAAAQSPSLTRSEVTAIRAKLVAVQQAMGADPAGYVKESEDFSHGLNERTPISNIAPGIDYYLSLVADLTK